MYDFETIFPIPQDSGKLYGVDEAVEVKIQEENTAFHKSKVVFTYNLNRTMFFVRDNLVITGNVEDDFDFGEEKKHETPFQYCIASPSYQNVANRGQDCAAFGGG
ncbi:predicted protein [Aspergillus terreus NIH2624]|uniref:Uncharacterized protein n=1 Tax=Aspergillus terreus (strain NIH 2624 / FGSC A1156) TaxID=341663 RepID=Q0CIJ8_ASPTN|nr:uncharacterized protein ATEG_06486 [Aspergillus terreus NIH2624]EAU33030.1 predicted protein [Aspergillus terreus NIH2624]